MGSIFKAYESHLFKGVPVHATIDNNDGVH